MDFRSTFNKPRVFLPVIHVENMGQAVRNVQVAVDGGADGVFLINHRINHSQLLLCYQAVKIKFPKVWVGLNFLDLEPDTAIESMKTYMSALWVDNADMPHLANKREKWENRWRAKFLFFGGVAFKYQREVPDVTMAARKAVPYVDVVTTSGIATGSPPDIEKIQKMRRGIGNHPLAIASGMTPENVGQFLPYVDCFLVATGVSDSHTELNPVKVRAFAEALK